MGDRAERHGSQGYGHAMVGKNSLAAAWQPSAWCQSTPSGATAATARTELPLCRASPSASPGFQTAEGTRFTTKIAAYPTPVSKIQSFPGDRYSRHL